MLGTFLTVGTILFGIFGYVVSRNFVRNRLRFVDAVRSPLAPLAAGVLAFFIAWPISILPFIGIGTAVAFAFGCAFGTASGVKALRRGEYNERQLRA